MAILYSALSRLSIQRCYLLRGAITTGAIYSELLSTQRCYHHRCYLLRGAIYSEVLSAQPWSKIHVGL